MKKYNRAVIIIILIGLLILIGKHFIYNNNTKPTSSINIVDERKFIPILPDRINATQRQILQWETILEENILEENIDGHWAKYVSKKNPVVNLEYYFNDVDECDRIQLVYLFSPNKSNKEIAVGLVTLKKLLSEWGFEKIQEEDLYFNDFYYHYKRTYTSQPAYLSLFESLQFNKGTKTKLELGIYKKIEEESVK